MALSCHPASVNKSPGSVLSPDLGVLYQTLVATISHRTITGHSQLHINAQENERLNKYYLDGDEGACLMRSALCTSHQGPRWIFSAASAHLHFWMRIWEKQILPFRLSPQSLLHHDHWILALQSSSPTPKPKRLFQAMFGIIFLSVNWA